ncbi:cyclin-dependent protein kinase inhibitor SMR6-like [Miscanthus floridulus]|uniref:cyclin-dependent protein kinase inhibitor SMR6-like n=1 Tax=Miscanthus floridulus TaxID=154761 RepID=UPI00345AE3EB
MGLPEVKRKQQLVHSTRVEDRHGHQHQQHQDGSKVWVLGLSGAGIAALPLQQLKPVKTGRRRHAATATTEEEGEEEPVTPRGEGWRIPTEAATCPPAPKKPRTAVSIIRSTAAAAGRRCNYDGGEVLDEFFRVPADLEAVFVARAAKAN